MYCAKCGVELADSEDRCPLCGTTAYHPEIEKVKSKKPYPECEDASGETIKQSGFSFIVALLFLIALCVTLTCDLKLSGNVTWSAYVLGALVLFYVVFFLPLWFKKPNPVIFSAVDFAVAGGFLLLIDLVTDGSWFLPFAFPVTGAAMVITVTVITLCHYLKRGRLYIFGGALIACGLYAVLIELMLHITFKTQMFMWSLYPLMAFFLLGMGLIVIAICKPLKESLRRKFFI